MSYLNYPRLFTALEFSNPWNEGPRDSRVAIVAGTISYLDIYLSCVPSSCRCKVIQREKEPGVSPSPPLPLSFLLFFLPLLYFASSFLFRETIIPDRLTFVAIVHPRSRQSLCVSVTGQFAAFGVFTVSSVVPSFFSPGLKKRGTREKLGKSAKNCVAWLAIDLWEVWRCARWGMDRCRLFLLETMGMRGTKNGEEEMKE